MALDEAIFKEVNAGNSMPTLRFFTWEQPAISIGYFQNPSSDLRLDLLKEKNIPWVRRITGGRAIFHHLELTYSISAPHDLTISSNNLFFPNDIKGAYYKISQGLAKGFKKLGLPVKLYSSPKEPSFSPRATPNPLCFSTPSWYEMMIAGKKVVGSAQKRFKNGFLQQGSILLNHRFEDFKDYFQLQQEKPNDFIGIFDFLGQQIPLADLETILISGLEETWGIQFRQEEPTPREKELCDRLTQQKYSADQWNLNRIYNIGTTHISTSHRPS